MLVFKLLSKTTLTYIASKLVYGSGQIFHFSFYILVTKDFICVKSNKE
ncbi:hypothetical Protein YC6258_00598 [Gynuella sunshinyii YC6258]|uniref:Uncharacterized protein n=1 Tax=Gynuella sunshinyii YC6258 TaxID=1445510 RepID=A0A0C5VH28_9GAMM|nr:hypothetical Protein YC6258_00598 [Gynuella sunshinyii YC6258]